MTDQTKRLVEAVKAWKGYIVTPVTEKRVCVFCEGVWEAEDDPQHTQECPVTLAHALKSTPPVTDPLLEQMAEALEKAHTELNAIRARDGVPHTSEGWPYGVFEGYFSSVVDGCSNALAAYRQRKEGTK